MYDKGSDERYKMLCALWRMKQCSKNHKERYVNSRVYEQLRIEYAEAVSKHTSETQKGQNNSQFGKHWYTNRNTGECKSFKELPTENFWIKGRNLFKNESSSIEKHKNSRKYDVRLYEAKRLWNEFHAGSFSSIRDFCRKTNRGLKLVMGYFGIIPAYKFVFIGRSHNNGSKKEFVNVFEV